MYDLLAGSQNIGKHRSLSRARALMMEPHLDGTGLAGAAVFYDCLIHSARFVLENVIDAARHGTVVVNYLRADDWQRSAGGYWRVSCTDKISGEHLEARARKLVNATGPWNRSGTLRLVRGSHIVIPRATSGDHAIAWFEPGGRIVFVIPWGEAAPVSLVGTTDVDHTGTPDEVEIAAEEREYLVAVVRRLFPKADTRVISSYASLRPLVADESSAAEKVSRQHRIWNDANGILHIAGGKYTTYRVMSAEAAGMIAAEIAPEIRGRDVTADAPLPGLPMPTGKEERVRQAYELEMAQTPDDVLHVSTYWGYEGVESPC
jgi:glycerol-3-phosphate dehydrogenase